MCRLWNTLAHEILYENIRVDNRFQALYTALQRPDTARLVRSLRLSTTRFDHNYAILALCPQLQIVVQPDALSLARSDSLVAISEPINMLHLPQFSLLKRIYWTESFMASGLLRRVLELASNLEHLFLSDSATLKADTVNVLVLPPVPSLHSLGFGRLVFNSVPSILQGNLQHLTHFTCPPTLLIFTHFPVLPALHMLTLSGARTSIPFPRIFSCCPCLREIHYDVRNGLWAPSETAAQMPLACVRLHAPAVCAAPGSRRDWTPLTAHFALFLSPEFPRLRRLVLHGGWADVVADVRFGPVAAGLGAQGCEVELADCGTC